jgi:hypothetical protein
MRAALEARRASVPTFAFTKDDVHPGREGHWVMAQAFLSGWLGLKTADLAEAEALFPRHGAALRALVRERQSVRFGAWMTSIGHQRPGVPGGPKAKPGLPQAEADAKAADLTARIQALR